MIVQCENCQTKFNVNPDRIKDEGSNVRCSQCRHVFKIFRPVPSDAPPPAEDFEEPSPSESEALPQESPTEKPSGDFDLADGPSAVDESLAGDMDFGDLGNDLDLSDDDLGLGDEAPAEADAGDLDFGDLDDDLGLGDEAPAEADAGDVDFGDLDDELGLGEGDDLGLGDEAPAEADADDMDFGDLDDELGLGEGDDLGLGDEAPAEADAGDVDFGDLDDELGLGEGDDLGLGDEAPAEADAGDVDFGDLDDELGLGEGDDLGLGDEAPAEAAAGDVDFGDLDDELGLGDDEDLGLGDEAPAEADAGDLDFGELDLGGEDGFDLSEEAPDGEAPADQGDDFGEDLGLGEPDDGLDFGALEEDLGTDQDGATEDAPTEEGLEEDLAGFGAGDGEVAGWGEEPADDDDDQDHRFDLEGPEDEDDFPFIDDLDHDGRADEIAREFAEPPRTKGRGLLWVVISLFIILAAGGAVFYFAPDMLSPVLKPLGLSASSEADEDAMGNKGIKPLRAKHSFKQNKVEGQLMVLTGLAKNLYKTPRSYLQLNGALDDGQGNILAEAKVYCGNVLSDEELTTLPLAEIQQKLSKPEGYKNVNMGVPPGKSVKFMFVFTVPKGLAGYTVEAYGSKPGS